MRTLQNEQFKLLKKIHTAEPAMRGRNHRFPPKVKIFFSMFFKLTIKRIRKYAMWKLFETHATDPKFEGSQFPPIEKFVKLLERVSYITTALHLSLAPLLSHDC